MERFALRGFVIAICTLFAACGHTQAETSRGRSGSPDHPESSARGVGGAHPDLRLGRSSSLRPWRLVKRPIVVVWQPADSRSPSYEVYIRLDHALATKHDAVLIELNSVSNYNTSGTGYDGSVRPHCYTKGIDNFRDFPKSLRTPRAGDLVTVTLRFRRPPRNILRTRVPLQVSRPGDAAPPTPNPGWLRMLGCST
jgi:hypothetical protein